MQKVSKLDDHEYLEHGTEGRSGDGWEELGEGVSIERLGDEPVEIDKEPSIADVQSLQSSSIEDIRPTDNIPAKDW